MMRVLREMFFVEEVVGLADRTRGEGLELELGLDGGGARLGAMESPWTGSESGTEEEAVAGVIKDRCWQRLSPYPPSDSPLYRQLVLKD